jgi:hypothetical protein
MMVMFRRPSKKQMVQRLIVYAVMVVAVLVIVTGAVLFILGYRLNSDRGQLEQVAIVQFDSRPNGATISIDGKEIGPRTATKQSVLVGTHNFIVSRDGYESWSKTLSLSARTLLWLDYVRLVPKERPVEKVATYPSVFGAKAAPDLQTVFVQEKAENPIFHLVDLRAQDVKSSLVTLPSDIYSEAGAEGVTHRFEMDEWDEGGRYLLLKHTYGDRSEWIVLDTEDIATSVNVTRLLSIDLDDVQFAGTSGNLLFGLSDGVIRKLDLSSATISRGLVTDVTAFDLFETNIITYVGTGEDGAKVAGVYRDGDNEAHVLRSTTSDLPLSIDATRYFSDDYVAIAEGLKVTLLKGRYPVSSDEDTSSLETFAEFTAAANVDMVSFSPGGDYLVAQSGLTFVGYEVEYQRLTNAAITTEQSAAQTLRWLDGAYLWTTYDGHVAVREFDGTNVRVINPAEAGFDATLSQNGRYLYSIGKSGDAYQLQRVKMILD